MTPLTSIDARNAPALVEADSRNVQPRWMQVMSDIHPKYGGISAAVPALATALVGSGVSASIAAFCETDECYLPQDLGTVPIHYWPASRKEWWHRSSLQGLFRHALRGVDGLHIHGMWQHSSYVAAAAAHALRTPYVVSAHGMLEPWALRQHRVRKQLYSLLVERRTLRQASCLHALTQAEANAYRNYVGRRPVAIIPNGVDTPENFSAQPFLQAHPQLGGRRIVLFLARLHPKKGVDLLVKAWLQIAAQYSDSTLVIAGPDSEGMRVSLEALCLDQPEAVLFAGMLDTEQKWSALAASECFVLPSYSEGLSMGVLEAMAAGTPVLLTPECNMPQVLDQGAGWLVNPSIDELAEALRYVLSRTPSQNEATGVAGRQFVEREYTWSSVGRRMADVYGWLQGGPVPTSCEVIL